MSKTTDSLSILKKLNFGGFKFTSEDKFEKAKQVWKLLAKYDTTFEDLGIEDPKECAKLFQLLEPDLKESAEEGTSVNNAQVKAATDEWKRLKAKLNFFYDVDKLKSQAREKVHNIKQQHRSAKQLLVDILELWKLADFP